MKRVGQIYRENLVDQIKEGVDQHNNVFLMSYSNVSASDISAVRKKLKEVGASVYVSRNKIAKRALTNLEFDNLADKVTMQTAFVWSDSDSVELAKLLVDYVKEFEHLSVQGGVLDGKVISEDQVTRLSELPSREVLLSMLLSTLQSPLTRLAGALSAKTRDLLSILKQLSEKKGGK